MNSFENVSIIICNPKRDQFQKCITNAFVALKNSL